ncbi:MAG: hypothetical protein HFE94_05980, partial [Acutalibacter sp.]|nr:hypothetical protein [Acutalibacter sp.]
QKIYDSGCRAFCVESRPYEDFCGESWWRDMEVMLSEAKKRDMKVWILDDKHYPTGYANGLLEKKYPHLHRWFLREHHADFMGPAKEMSLRLPKLLEDDKLVSVCAYRRTGVGEELAGEPIVIPVEPGDEFAYFDVPEGCWRVFVMYKTNREVSPHSKWHVNFLSEESVHVLIEAVYESHYEHFPEYFGSTLAGFFSDEPAFDASHAGLSGHDGGMYYRTVGQPGIMLPWDDVVAGSMGDEGRSRPLADLPGLWYPIEGRSPEVRLAYMNAVTKLWRKCFSYQLGDWCRAHGVQYIGHVIEDMNAHARLGSSCGHYFRALEGQDMSGIDIVLHQVMPGMAQYMTSACISGGVSDPGFFHYILAQLAASLARQNPAMEGRAMCEVFGAYGWAEGVPCMKWLMDFLLVRGVNHFVPHAFTDFYPDPDCPPHFYADGNNPQFAAFTKLMEYTNRAAHLLYGAEMEAAGAVFYHAEAEWMNGGCMFSQEPAKACYDAHIPYELASLDFLEKAGAKNGRFGLPERRYGFLAVPSCDRLPELFWEQARRLHEAGVPVFFVEPGPKCSGPLPGETVSLEELPGKILALGLAHDYGPSNKLLRIARFDREGSACFMLFNEAPHRVSGEITLPVKGRYLAVDLLNGEAERGGTEGNASVCLEPGESLLLIFDDFSEVEWNKAHDPFRAGKTRELDLAWDIEVLEQGINKDYQPLAKSSKLFNITGKSGLPGFSGKIKYHASFSAGTNNGRVLLDLGAVGMTASLIMNGQDMGQRVCAPYRWDVTNALYEGENTLEVVVCNTLTHRLHDCYSEYMPIPPSGLLGPVKIVEEEY